LIAHERILFTNKGGDQPPTLTLPHREEGTE
jgi:hypothetical protein